MWLYLAHMHSRISSPWHSQFSSGGGGGGEGLARDGSTGLRGFAGWTLLSTFSAPPLSPLARASLSTMAATRCTLSLDTLPKASASELPWLVALTPRLMLAFSSSMFARELASLPFLWPPSAQPARWRELPVADIGTAGVVAELLANSRRRRRRLPNLPPSHVQGTKPADALGWKSGRQAVTQARHKPYTWGWEADLQMNI